MEALSAVRLSFEALEEHTGVRPELYNLPPDDPDTYAMISRGEMLGKFQIESRAQIASILHTRPERLYDIVVQVALIRPGPIQGNFVHPYTNRRRGREMVTYAHPALESILKLTQVIPIFQEQVMALPALLGGSSHAQADKLRHAIGNVRKTDKLRTMIEELKAMMVANEAVEPRVTPNVAEQIGNDLLTFANYGFHESHTWSFALIAYASDYLKCHHPAFFYLRILNARPIGFILPQPSFIMRDVEGSKFMPRA